MKKRPLDLLVSAARSSSMCRVYTSPMRFCLEDSHAHSEVVLWYACLVFHSGEILLLSVIALRLNDLECDVNTFETALSEIVIYPILFFEYQRFPTPAWVGKFEAR